MTPPARLKIDFLHGRRSLSLAEGGPHRLTDVLRQNDIPLNTRCGNRGLCDGCFVELIDGSLADAVSGIPLPSAPGPIRVRACQYCLPAGECAEIWIPSRSLLAHEPQIVTSFCLGVPCAHDPLWQVMRISPTELSVKGKESGAICQAVARKHGGKSPLSADPSLTTLEQDDASAVTVSIQHQGDHWSVRPIHALQDTGVFGAVLDVGTTTVVALLVALSTGEIVAESSALNAQVDLGDNVLTRINLCMNDEEMVGCLQRALMQRTIGPLLSEILGQAGASVNQLVCVTVAGNSTMLHLLSGVDPTSMGTAPFTPTFLDHRVLAADLIPWEDTMTGVEPNDDSAKKSTGFVPSNASVHLLPGAGAYIGADIVAGVLSTGVAYSTEVCMLVDVGTNGEIVLKHGDRLLACATAAGPAFEGRGLRCGVRAGKGAISHVSMTHAGLEIEVIGGCEAVGICGTAYLDFMAQARRLGLIGHTGRFVRSAISDWQVESADDGLRLIVAHGRDREPIYVTEGDMASLLQAKAAIAAGIVCLLEKANLRSADMASLLLAGGFGYHIDSRHAIDVGLLPGFRPSQIQLVGNSSLAGGYLALLDSGALEEMSRVASKIELVELNLEPQFESRFIDHLTLP